MFPSSELKSYTLVDIEPGCVFIALATTKDEYHYICKVKYDRVSQIPPFVTGWNDVVDHIVEVNRIFLPTSECSICLEQITQITDLVVLKCGHVFCENCQKKLAVCPSCRFNYDSSSIVRFSRDPMLITKDLLLLPLSDLLCYKVVGILIKPNPNAFAKIESDSSFPNGGIILDKVSALLSMQVESDRALVYAVESGSGIVPFSQLSPTIKYCTNSAKVLSVRLVGDKSQIRQALLALQTDNASFVSYHDSKTEYGIGQYTIVPTAGVGCGNSRCGSGVYFFTDEKSTLNFWAQRNDGNKKSTPWITKTITLPNGVKAFSVSDVPHATRKSLKLDHIRTTRKNIQKWCDKNNAILHERLNDPATTTNADTQLITQLQNDVESLVENQPLAKPSTLLVSESDPLIIEIKNLPTIGTRDEE